MGIQTTQKSNVIDLDVISAPALRLLRGENSRFFDRVRDVFGVSIEEHKGDDQIKRLVISGDSRSNVQTVRNLLNDMQVKAQQIITEEAITDKHSVNSRIYRKLAVYEDVAFPQYASQKDKDLTVRDIIERVAGATAERMRGDVAAEFGLRVAESVAAPAVARDSQPRPKQQKLSRGGQIPLLEFEPRNQAQAIGYLATQDREVSWIFMFGPGGSSKSYTAMRGATEAFNRGVVEGINFIRTKVTTSGINPGAYKGDPDKKDWPYMEPFARPYADMTDRRDIAELKKAGVGEFFSPDHKKGDTFAHRFSIIDEAQDLTGTEARVLYSRNGEGSKTAFLGDLSSNQQSLGGQLPGIIGLVAKVGHMALTNDQLAGMCAFICFSAHDASARHAGLPLMHEAMAQTEIEGFHDIPDRYQANGQAEYMEKVAENTAFAMQMMEQNYAVTYERYKDEAMRRWPHLWPEMANVAVLERDAG